MIPSSNSASAIASVPDSKGLLPRHSSTEGRFSIIDEQTHGSDSDSELESTQAPLATLAKKTVSQQNFSKSVDFSQTGRPMANNVSRFRIVPLESRYKRGRWTCYDHYEKGALPTKMVAAPEALHPNDLSVRSLNDLPPGTPRVTFSFNLSDSESEHNLSKTDVASTPGDRPPNILPLLRGQPELFSSPQPLTSPQPVKCPPPDLATASSPLLGRITPTHEMLQTGLESTLNTTELKRKVEQKGRRRISTGSSPHVLPLDSKIEQAMDLVKTHLMYAVREEVEVLRLRIRDLENTVFNLESENAVLRQHVGADVLKNLSS